MLIPDALRDPADGRLELATDVFRQHDLFTLQSAVLSYGPWTGLRLFPLDRRNRDHQTLDMQVGPERSTLYLLHIWLPHPLRGLGFGQQLYEQVCELAGRLGQERVVLTPSGTANRRESRADYLRRRGWLSEGDVHGSMFKEV